MPSKEDFEFDLNRKISSQKAFLIIIILSLLVASYTIIAAQKIVSSAEESPIFNLEKRAKENVAPIKNVDKNIAPGNLRNIGK